MNIGSEEILEHDNKEVSRNQENWAEVSVASQCEENRFSIRTLIINCPPEGKHNNLIKWNEL